MLVYTTPGVVGVSDRTQIGPAVDAELWERFRQDVQARKGQVRGVLGDELENAIREYLRDEPNPTEKDIDARLSRIESRLGITESDGGLPTSNANTHTRAPSRVEESADEKPPANAATEKKIRYLAECVIESEVPETRTVKQVPKDKLRDVVKTEYGFRSDTAKRYVDEIKDYFDLEQHPKADSVLVTPEERERIIDKEREEMSGKADKQMNEIMEGAD